MNQKLLKKLFVFFLILLFVGSSFISVSSFQITGTNTVEQTITYSVEVITKNYTFSDPLIVERNDTVTVALPQANLNQVNFGKPVLPVNITVMKFPLGTKVVSMNYTVSEPEIHNLSKPLAMGTLPLTDSLQENTGIASLSNAYPEQWVSYNLGGGLFQENHTTFFSLRIYPVRYYPDQNQLQSIHTISVNLTVRIPTSPLIPEKTSNDLLIITPKNFLHALQPLVTHKNSHGVKTDIVSLNTVYTEMQGQGRDNPEKIKNYIKNAIEQWGTSYVLLVGGIKGQSFQWHFPVRYSHVVPYDEQEYAEQSFLSDLYYADIYDNEGNFSNWDSNHNNIFGEWTTSAYDTMDLYPDVYLGRLPCLNNREVKIMVDKIITYETNTRGKSWFNSMVFVAGDSYNDTHHYNEGEIIAAEVASHMPGFIPVNVFSSQKDINKETVNSAMNNGSGFAYFCGHGNPQSWNTHYPPNGTIWTTGYTTRDMNYLNNNDKLPVVVVGGCHNGQFDVTLRNILKGIREEGLRYFSSKGTIGGFWYNEWIPRCWSWQLTVKKDGGAIATISNTGLGTHGDGDTDYNGIADYLEILNGWMEIRFFQLYGEQHQSILGENHGQTLIDYLNRFIGNNDKMDIKMVQQWELFGDPSMQIGGY